MKKREMVHHTYSVIHQLEQFLDNVKRLISERKTELPDLPVSVQEQERILQQMRRIANKLQLEIAKSNWPGVVRTLRIFYGMNQMIRPELVATLIALSTDKGLRVVNMSQRAATCH